jgi:hypothetical protein
VETTPKQHLLSLPHHPNMAGENFYTVAIINTLNTKSLKFTVMTDLPGIRNLSFCRDKYFIRVFYKQTIF